MHSRNFGSDKFVRSFRMYVHPFMKAGVKFLHFKDPRVALVNCMATQIFREKKYNNNKADSFFRLNFNVYIDVKWRTEKELERETKKKKKKKKETNFISAVRK